MREYYTLERLMKENPDIAIDEDHVANVNSIIERIYISREDDVRDGKTYLTMDLIDCLSSDGRKRNYCIDIRGGVGCMTRYDNESFRLHRMDGGLYDYICSSHESNIFEKDIPDIEEMVKNMESEDTTIRLKYETVCDTINFSMKVKRWKIDSWQRPYNSENCDAYELIDKSFYCGCMTFLNNASDVRCKVDYCDMYKWLRLFKSVVYMADSRCDLVFNYKVKEDYIEYECEYDSIIADLECEYCKVCYDDASRIMHVFIKKCYSGYGIDAFYDALYKGIALQYDGGYRPIVDFEKGEIRYDN